MERLLCYVASCFSFFQDRFLRYFLSIPQRKTLIKTCDPVRYGSVLLSINNIKKNNIKGAFAEAGVFKGDLSRFIHDLAPERTFYLFDTFQGFPKESLDGKKDERFKNTSLDLVKKKIGNLDNLIFRIGYFPETARGLEDERFSFVMIDFDLYESTIAALNFFYPRVTPGGYIFIHDYNSPESEWGVSRAVSEFMKDKSEKIIEIPDACGSVIIRKS